VGVVAGGTSVNSIPTEMSMDVDLCSESPVELNRLVEAFREVVNAAVDQENRSRSTAEGRVVADLKLIGDRPAGETGVDTPLISTTVAALKVFGLKPSFRFSSTDSNIPIDQGIPAVTVAQGFGGRFDDWTAVEKASAVRAAEVALAIVLGAADAR
jgi:tripeptide aminopeptidase